MAQDNAADPKQIRRAQKASALADQQDGQVIASIMSTVNGRAWVWRWLEACHLFENPYDDNDRREAFLLGEANIGRRLLAQIHQHCPDQYIQAQREANERYHTDARRNNDSRRRSPGDDAATERPGEQDAGRDVEGSDYDPYNGPRDADT